MIVLLRIFDSGNRWYAQHTTSMRLPVGVDRGCGTASAGRWTIRCKKRIIYE
jgi:hypothetical protein